tara:strand:- start:289 stop:795 length:507 start_codon:yes stop_codon:yes gene_type:complete
MSNHFKIILITLLGIFISSTSSFALCDFEKVSIGKTLKSFQETYIGTIKDRSDRLHSYDISLDKVCRDQFEQAIAQYSFINKKLHKIKITDFQSETDFLKSLKYYYGKPTNGYDRPGTSGIAYYHWNKSGKSIFLLDSINPDLRTQTIEIISDRYNELSGRYMNYDNE